MGSTQSLSHSYTCCGIFPVDKSEYMWNVKDFKKLLSENVGYSTCSDDLSARVKEDTETFKLVLYPNGFNERVKGYASLWLQKLSSKEERRIKFTCAVIRGRCELLNKSVTQSLGLETCLGWMAFCQRNIISSALMDDTLSLKCTIEIFSEKAFVNPGNEGSELVESVLLSELSSDLGLLVSEKDYSDFSIEVQGSDRHSDEDLKEVCIEYIIKNASQVQEPKDWINFSVLCSILPSSQLEASGIILKNRYILCIYGSIMLGNSSGNCLHKM
ncbi:hypothetical protein JTE90_011081 [Oedothorax gibbosus]|uniref:MATH domain-containing protein n=1 Tax=Oedothorax gibbosus TaxID=931172 RepID=A0AAV6ULA0_9ARAC|nr:hypothetical protein JTE90_011081 [Oedothorax gibbosus]